MPEGPHAPGDRIYRGAEATLTAVLFMGRLGVAKQRRPKGYRLPAFEAPLARGRMRNEARLLHRARSAGVGAPALLDADLDSQTLLLEYLGRHPLRVVYDGLDAAKRRQAARRMGESVARLHKADIIHGDLTTSNMILRGGRVYLIDFSLGHISGKLEDRAVDLKAFKDSFAATHLQHAGDFAEVLRSYRAVLGGSADQVVGHIASIERRRRYA
jgi:TP53 regulating kinase-like protein